LYRGSRTEGFQNEKTGTKTKTIVKYERGEPWDKQEVLSWKARLMTAHTKYQNLQDDIQAVYNKYLSVESKLEQAARKKHTHWLTMTPADRERAGMIDDPIQAYYAPITSLSRLPLGGLKDNEGNLPFGIPRVSLLGPDEAISFAWEPKSNGEATFYQNAKEYVDSLGDVIRRTGKQLDILAWSTTGNKKASLLPRVETLKKDSDEKQKELQAKKKEGFATTTTTIQVYPYYSATHLVNRAINHMETMTNTIQKTRDDVSRAAKLVDEMDNQGKKTHQKLRAAAAGGRN